MGLNIISTNWSRIKKNKALCIHPLCPLSLQIRKKKSLTKKKVYQKKLSHTKKIKKKAQIFLKKYQEEISLMEHDLNGKYGRTTIVFEVLAVVVF